MANGGKGGLYHSLFAIRYSPSARTRGQIVWHLGSAACHNALAPVHVPAATGSLLLAPADLRCIFLRAAPARAFDVAAAALPWRFPAMALSIPAANCCGLTPQHPARYSPRSCHVIGLLGITPPRSRTVASC